MNGIVPFGGSNAFERDLYYGGFGFGKTTLAALVALKRAKKDGKRVLWLDTDRKLESLQNLPAEFQQLCDVWKPKSGPVSMGSQIGIARIEMYEGSGQNRKKVAGTEGFVPQNVKGYFEIVQFLNDLLKIPADKFPYSTVVLDTITSTVEYLMRDILANHKVSTMTMQLWGVFASNMEEFRGGLLSFPAHVCMIAHTITREGEDAGGNKEIRILPSVPGQTGEKLGKDFNEVYHFEGRNEATKKWMVRVIGNKMVGARSSRFKDTALVSTDDILEKA